MEIKPEIITDILSFVMMKQTNGSTICKRVILEERKFEIFSSNYLTSYKYSLFDLLGF